MPQLSFVINYLKELDKVIKDLRNGMKHSHPYSVDALRHTVKELEDIKETLLTAELRSGKNLESILEKVRDCIRACIRPPYTGMPEVLPKPVPEKWAPPVTVTGVNIIFVVDISRSMFVQGGGMETNGRIRKLLIAMAKEIKKYADQAKIPTKVSTLYYADPSNPSNQKGSEKRFWQIGLKHETDLDKLAKDFETVNRNAWAIGKDCPESGLTAMYKALDLLFDHSELNGKPIENSLILVSDDVQKADDAPGSDTCPKSHPNFKEVKINDLKNKLKQLKMKNVYALLPRYYGSPRCGNGRKVNNWGWCYMSLFTDHKEYWQVKNINDVYDWVLWTLDPSSAPHNQT